MSRTERLVYWCIFGGGMGFDAISVLLHADWLVALIEWPLVIFAFIKIAGHAHYLEGLEKQL